MKKYLVICFFLIGCSSNQDDIKNNEFDSNLNDDLTFEEFKFKLMEYAENSSYPNIDD